MTYRLIENVRQCLDQRIQVLKVKPELPFKFLLCSFTLETACVPNQNVYSSSNKIQLYYSVIIDVRTCLLHLLADIHRAPGVQHVNIDEITETAQILIHHISFFELQCQNNIQSLRRLHQEEDT